MIAFEIAKKLSALKLKVGFLASFNLPPHIKARMQQLDWIETVLTLATFLGLIPEETAIGESAALHSRAFNPEDQVLDWVIACAPSPRLAELDLDKEKLRHWAHLSISLHSLAKEYEPKGSVKNMDVFYASPLLSVGVESKEVWLETQLKKWEGFVEGDVVYHDCVGNHWTMLDGENCWGFQKTLKDALAKRGVL
jgi:thioesterase domain-containing protein